MSNAAMKRLGILVVSSALVLGGACKKTETEETTSAANTATTSETMATATSATDTSATTASSSAAPAATAPANLSDDDKKFAEKAAIGGMLEVQLAGMATQKAASPDVKSFAQRLNDDHSKANSELTQLVTAKGLTPPAALDKDAQEMVSKLTPLSGAKFDHEYAEMMVHDHKEDIDLFEKEAKDGKDADLKAFAAKTLPTLKEHLTMAKTVSDKVK